MRTRLTGVVKKRDRNFLEIEVPIEDYDYFEFDPPSPSYWCPVRSDFFYIKAYTINPQVNENDAVYFRPRAKISRGGDEDTNEKVWIFLEEITRIDEKDAAQ